MVIAAESVSRRSVTRASRVALSIRGQSVDAQYRADHDLASVVGMRDVSALPCGTGAATIVH
jgi:hypothetical protein